MCGRYWIDDTLEQRQIAEEMMRSALVGKWQKTTEVKTHGEIRPTDVVPVIAPNRSGVRTVYPMKWGYSGRSLLINARSETAAEKPTFREDWARHRCIVPASWYFEWEHHIDKGGKKRTGDKYMIMPKETMWEAYPVIDRSTSEIDLAAAKGNAHRADFGMTGSHLSEADTVMTMDNAHETSHAMTWLCGLYRIEGGLPVFVILTREPGEKIRFIHDRMPLIMPGELVNEWIRPGAKPEELLPYALTEMDFEKAL